VPAPLRSTVRRHLRVRRITAAVLLTVVSAQSWALQPCSTRPDEYLELLRSELRRQVPKSTIATYLVMPSFRPEYGLVVSQGNAFAQVTVVQFVTSVWSGSWDRKSTQGSMTQDFSRSSLETVKYHVTLSSELTALLKEIMTSRISYTDEPRYGLDGVTYVLATADGKCGQTWSPAKATRDRLLVETFEKLRELAKDSSPAHQRAIDSQLVGEFKAQWAPVTPDSSLERTRER
jgi:hypothetical protein